MTQDEALRILENILGAAQRIRSIVSETLGTTPAHPQEMGGMLRQAYDRRLEEAGVAPRAGLHLSEQTLAWRFPYLFGEANLVVVCDRLLTFAQRPDGFLAPLDLYDVLVMAQRETLLGAWFASRNEPPLPAPDLGVMRGWDPPATSPSPVPEDA